MVPIKESSIDAILGVRNWKEAIRRNLESALVHSAGYTVTNGEEQSTLIIRIAVDLTHQLKNYQRFVAFLTIQEYGKLVQLDILSLNMEHEKIINAYCEMQGLEVPVRWESIPYMVTAGSLSIQNDIVHCMSHGHDVGNILFGHNIAELTSFALMTTGSTIRDGISVTNGRMVLQNLLGFCAREKQGGNFYEKLWHYCVETNANRVYPEHLQAIVNMWMQSMTGSDEEKAHRLISDALQGKDLGGQLFKAMLVASVDGTYA